MIATRCGLAGRPAYIYRVARSRRGTPGQRGLASLVWLGFWTSGPMFFMWRIEMNRTLIVRAAVTMAVLVCVSVALESQANACLGLFKRKCCENSCSSCSSEPSCGCAAPAAEPSCGCAKAEPSCAAPAEPSCAAPAAAPSCGAPAEPSCGCSASSEPSCGCESSCGCGHRCRLFSGLFHRHCGGGCQASCGCSAAPSCGCSS
jgi:hypothetical protein